jgi:hypothetical protein
LKKKKKYLIANFYLLFSPLYSLYYTDLSIFTTLKRRVNEVLSELGLMNNQQNIGTVSCVSIVLLHLLKELPIEVIGSNVVHILHLIEFNKDNSFDQVCICNFYYALILLVHYELFTIFYLVATFFVSVFPICFFNVLFGNTAP